MLARRVLSLHYFMHFCSGPPDYARKDHLISLLVKSWNRSEMKSKKKGMRRRSNCRDHLCYLRLNQKYENHPLRKKVLSACIFFSFVDQLPI